jgi:hypothetical protein
MMADGTKKQIKDIAIGDSVYCVDPVSCEPSITKVVQHYTTQTDKKIKKITTISGRTIIVTYDHLFLTLNGWKKAENLIKEKVCVFTELNQDESCISTEEYIKYLLYVKGKSMDKQTWNNTVVQKNKSLFIPILSIEDMPNVRIADITTESLNHNFIGGEGFCVHNSSMGKQALGVPLLTYNIRTDTSSHILHYSQRPIVSTKTADLLGFNEMTAGMNVIVAIAAYTGLTSG